MKLWNSFIATATVGGSVPKHAFVLSDKVEYWTKTDRICQGDILLIYPGEMIPVDGVILEGDSVVDAMNQKKRIGMVRQSVGDHVFRGSLNRSERLKIKATRPASGKLF